MGLVTQRQSDISGKVGPESDFVQVVVRSGVGLDKAVVFDALKSEVSKLKTASDVVELELKNGSGDPQRVVVSRDEFKAIVGDEKKVLAAARNLRGREPKRQA